LQTKEVYNVTEFMVFLQRHQDALELEVTVLRRLLRRNELSHRRAGYWQRLRMFLRCLERKSSSATIPNLLELCGSSAEFLDRLESYVSDQKTKRKRRRVFWELGEDETATATKKKGNVVVENYSPARNEESSELASLQEWHSSLFQAMSVDHRLDPVFSRLHLAARLLWNEMARGFFLPFCAVAIGALARIRWLLVQLLGHVSRAVLPRAIGLFLELQHHDDNSRSSSEYHRTNRLSTELDRIQAFLQSEEDDSPPSASSSSVQPSSTHSRAEAKRRKLDRKLSRACRELSIPLPLPGRHGADDRKGKPRGRPETFVIGEDENDDDDDDDATAAAVEGTTNDADNLDNDLLHMLSDEGGASDFEDDETVLHPRDNDRDGTDNDIGAVVAGAVSRVKENDEDVGESVVGVVVDPRQQSPSWARTALNASQHADDDPHHLDKNLEWAMRLGKRKRSSKSGGTSTASSDEKKRGQEGDAAPQQRVDSTTTAPPVRKTKSKKDKKTKKQKRKEGGETKDFFDDLFAGK
jgi:hypothetical protein